MNTGLAEKKMFGGVAFAAGIACGVLKDNDRPRRLSVTRRPSKAAHKTV
jgi:hypothetical protein